MKGNPRKTFGFLKKKPELNPGELEKHPIAHQNWKSIVAVFSKKHCVLTRIHSLNPGTIGITRGELVIDNRYKREAVFR